MPLHGANHHTVVSDFFDILDRKHRWAYILSYTAFGFVLGSVFVLSAWIVDLQSHSLPWNWSSLDTIHRQNLLLVWVDASPFVSALFFGMIGRIQAKLKISNLELEDRVRERMVELTLEKARSNAILDTAADGIINFDEDGRILVYNNAAERIFGYRRNEVLGRDIRMLVPVLEDWEGPRLFSRLVNLHPDEALPGDSSRELEALQKDGTTIPIELDVSKFTVGEEVSYTAIVRDISERRRAQRLERSMQKMTEALNQTQDLPSLYNAIHDSLSQIIQTTNFQIALVAEDHRSFQITYSVDQFDSTPLPSQPAERSLLGQVLKEGKPLLIESEEYEKLCLDGRIVRLSRAPVSWLGVPLMNLGKAIGVMAVQSFTEGVKYTNRDVWIMNLLSAQVANAIEREHARDALRQSERRYRRMIEEAGDIVYTTNVRGVFTYLNPQASRLTGYPEQELIGQHWTKLVAPDWHKATTEFYANQFRTKQRETTLEFPIITKDGQTRWLEQKTTLQMEDGERLVGLQSIVHDITERRAAEAALREREERFRSLSASSPIGIFQLDAGGDCIYTNKRLQEITGRTPEETLGTGWIDCIHPEERETFRTEWIFTRFDTANAASEVRVQRKNGENRWVNIGWAATYDKDESLTGFVGTFQDITEQKRMERVNQVLYGISQAQQSTSDLQEFFASLQDSLDSIIDTTNFYVALFNEEKRTISFPYARENREQKLDLEERPLGKGLTGIVLRSGKPLLLDEAGLQRLYDSGEAQLIGKPTKNWLGVPLISNGKVMGAVVLQSYTDAAHYRENDVQMMNFVSSQIATAIVRKQTEEAARRYTRELAEAHNRIKEDLRMAARIQKARLPREAPGIPDVEFEWFFDSCDEVAGDMFNFVQLDDHRLGIYILDVSGHGIPAALLSMSLSRSLTAAPDGSGALVKANGAGLDVSSPAHVASVMNDRYPMNLETNQYFTMIYGILDTASMIFTFVRAGHPPPILVKRNGEARELDEVCGPAIGILPSVEFEEMSVELEPGDRIILFTDGVDESTNRSGEEFGIGRVITALARIRGGTVSDNVRVLRESIIDFSQGLDQHDDITIVGFGIKEPVTALAPAP